MLDDSKKLTGIITDGDIRRSVSRQEAKMTRVLGTDPASGKEVTVRLGRFGPHAQIGSVDDEEKPKFAGLQPGLRLETINLEETNTALRVLLKQKDETRKELEEKVLLNIKDLVIPVLLKLKTAVGLDQKQAAYITVMKNTLNDIISGFTRSLSSRQYCLTPTELQVASLIRQGKPTKDIAAFMNLSGKTIETHRRNIRGKIGIKNQKVNLRTHLLTMN